MIRVTITGASGFIGQHVIASAPAEWQIAGLSRGSPRPTQGQVSWRQADLFSLRSSTEALKDTDVAIYLVHSMLPSTRLFQGNFADADLLIADNFVRACVANGVKQIIYLGGLVPLEKISEHLESRKEVEEVIKASGTPYTIFRAGMVAGNGGSSFEILRNLVTNLPAMILPQWTQSKTQVIYVDDLVRILSAAVMKEEFFNKTIDAVNGESLTYEKLIRTTSAALGKRRFFVHVPIHSTGFSKLWVSIFGETDYELASPLIDSLLCELPQEKPIALIAPLIREPTFAGMLATILRIDGRKNRREKAKLLHRNTVRSIQRLPATPSLNADQIAQEYQAWLGRTFLGLIRVKSGATNELLTFNLRGLRWPLLVLKAIPGESESTRAKFHIVGGWLSGKHDISWLEFRQLAKRRFTIVSINEFVPTLPWLIYRFTQAVLHLWTMTSFGEYLKESKK